MEILSALPVTIVFVAVFALIQIPMTVAVGLRRLQTDVQFLDGGDNVLLQRMRAHGNFTETVPIALLAMAAAELAGAPHALLWAGGTALLLGRLVHYATIVTTGFGIGPRDRHAADAVFARAVSGLRTAPDIRFRRLE